MNRRSFLNRAALAVSALAIDPAGLVVPPDPPPTDLIDTMIRALEIVPRTPQRYITIRHPLPEVRWRALDQGVMPCPSRFEHITIEEFRRRYPHEPPELATWRVPR